MHRVMLISSLVGVWGGGGGRLAPLCPISKCPPSPYEPPTYLRLKGLLGNGDGALFKNPRTLNNLSISAGH